MDLVVGIITLLVAIATLYVSYITYRDARKSDKKRIKEEIACKQAELNILNSTTHFIDSTTMNNVMIRKSVLQNEIEVLKKQLQNG